jgi:hypothetical protein
VVMSNSTLLQELEVCRPPTVPLYMHLGTILSVYS